MKIPEIGYRSPVIRWDPLAQVEIFERRNTHTGEVSFQDPSAAEVRLLSHASGPDAGPATAAAPPSGNAPPNAPDPHDAAAVAAPSGGVSLLV